MAGPVALLLKAAPQQNASKSAKSSGGDDPGDEFKVELGRAQNRQSSESRDQNDDTKKADKTSSAKKPHAKGKSRKSEDHEPDPDVTAETHSSGKNRRQTDSTTAVDDAAEEVTSDTPADADSAAESAKPEDQSSTADASAVASNGALPMQNSPTVVSATRQDGVEQGAATAVKATAINESISTSAEATSDAAADQLKADLPGDAEQLVTEQTTQDGESTDGAKTKTHAAEASVDAVGEDSQVMVLPRESRAKSPAADPNAAGAHAEAALSQVSDDRPEVNVAEPHAVKSTDTGPSFGFSPDLSNKSQPAAAAQVAKADQPQLPPEARFAEANHPDIVKGIQTQLMPRGGTMQLRLDPPELGALQVILTVKDGVLNATFQTASDDSSRLLSHSLGQLKAALETAGVTVDKLQVTHAPRDTQTNTGSDDQRHQPGQDDMSRQQEQQRKEMIKRMWRKLAGESDPLDLVA